MKKKQKSPKHKSQRTALSLRPLSFDEAVADILKVKPEPKDKKSPKKV